MRKSERIKWDDIYQKYLALKDILQGRKLIAERIGVNVSVLNRVVQHFNKQQKKEA